MEKLKRFLFEPPGRYGYVEAMSWIFVPGFIAAAIIFVMQALSVPGFETGGVWVLRILGVAAIVMAWGGYFKILR